MIGDSVVKTSRSGTRLILIRLRLATTSAVGQRSWTTLIGSSPRPARGRPASLRASSSARVPGEGEEHVVERRPAQADVVARRSPAASRRRSASTSTAAPPRDRASAATGGARRPRPGRPRAAGAARRRGPAAPGCDDLSSRRSPPTWALSWSAVPWAMTLPWSMTTMSSASRSASSRYWVVSSSVVPPATRLWMTSHMSVRLRGSRPVVGSSRNSTGGSATRAPARSRRRRMPPE